MCSVNFFGSPTRPYYLIPDFPSTLLCVLNTNNLIWCHCMHRYREVAVSIYEKHMDVRCDVTRSTTCCKMHALR